MYLIPAGWDLQLECELGLGPGRLHLHVVARLLDLEVPFVQFLLSVVGKFAGHALFLRQSRLDQRVAVALRLSYTRVSAHLGRARLAHGLHVILLVFDLAQGEGDHLDSHVEQVGGGAIENLFSKLLPVLENLVHGEGAHDSALVTLQCSGGHGSDLLVCLVDKLLDGRAKHLVVV